MNQLLAATECRPLDEMLLAGVVDSMCRSTFKIAGSADRTLYEAICRDSLDTDRVCIEVAASDDRVEGFLVVIIDWKKYWVRRLLRHPVAAIRTVWRRLERLFMKRAHDCVMSSDAKRRLTSLIGTGTSGRRWEQSNASIGKVLFVYVDPEGRGKSIASVLYCQMFSELRRRGVVRCDARIACENLASVRAHLKAGFGIEKAQGSLFATVDL
jgi:GNAT superfamily N-acetyltransferase